VEAFFFIFFYKLLGYMELISYVYYVMIDNPLTPNDMKTVTEQLTTIFSQDELLSLMTAVGGYMNTKRNNGKSTDVEIELFDKVTDAFLLSSELNAVEVSREFVNGSSMGVAEYKMSEALLETM
jgi:ethanolamine utilization microcompartment shell protein EutS